MVKYKSEIKGGTMTEKSTSIHHFYEKLLVLTEHMHTGIVKRMAEERHRWLEMYLEQFFKEWNGDQ